MIKKDTKIIVYQILTRLFGNLTTTNAFSGDLATNGVGKFNDVNTAALQALKAFGITHVWYTGVIEHATQTDYSVYGIKPDHPDVVKGKAGSPYAIKDYYDVDPDLAESVEHRMQEFEALVKRTHDTDLAVIIDFVPNHVARQYASDRKPDGVADFGEHDDAAKGFLPDNNFYYIPEQVLVLPESAQKSVSQSTYYEYPAKASGNDVFHAYPSVHDWYETVKLNYGINYLNHHQVHFDPIPDTWIKMRDILLFWAEKGVDGFRCDMAEMVPVAFWSWVIEQVQLRYPSCIFIAEIYNPNAYEDYLFSGKFTYLYDKVGLYDALRRLVEGGGTVEDITRVWQQESGTFSDRMLRFLENHDEQRIASRYFAGDGFSAFPAMVLAATLHAGPLMLYFGQEIGVNPTEAEGFQGDDGRTTLFDYWGIPEFQRWVNENRYDGALLTENERLLREHYQWLNHFIRQNEAVHSGQFHDLQYLNSYGQSAGYSHEKLYSYLRFCQNQILLFVINFDKNRTYDTAIRISEDVWVHTLGLDTQERYTMVKRGSGVAESPTIVSARPFSDNGVPLVVPANSFQIFEIRPTPLTQ